MTAWVCSEVAAVGGGSDVATPWVSIHKVEEKLHNNLQIGVKCNEMVQKALKFTGFVGLVEATALHDGII
ncbi:hypothetical protein SDJN02_22437, partial [Cucurbita argyrosperma subsp. argyrosperma]